MFDVAVIGAGIVGTAIARELARYDVRTVLIEKESDIACGATKANSAIVHAGYDPEPGSLKALLNAAGNPMFDQLCRELGVPFKRIGSLVVAVEEAELKILEELYQRGKRNGIPGLEIVGKDRLRTLEPRLKESLAGALYAATAGIVDPWELAIALAENAAANGVEIRLNSPVAAIRRAEEGYLLTVAGTELRAKYVINAAGVYADTINDMVAPRAFAITPVKGQYLLFDKRAGDFVRHIVFQCPTPRGKGVVILPTVHGNLLLGPTAEEAEEKDDVRTTARGLDMLKEQAERVVGGLPFEQVITSFAGLRAKTAAGDFIIGESREAKGFINVAAIDSPGLTAAPAIARRVVELLAEIAGPLPEKSSFNPVRRPPVLFRELSAEEKARLIREDPRYGRIICRCEGITEGEIVQAVRHPVGASTVDGVKKRTRAGMGRCQGGFCAPRVLKIIAREMNVDPTLVTKDGAGSYILTGPTKEGNGPLPPGGPAAGWEAHGPARGTVEERSLSDEEAAGRAAREAAGKEAGGGGTGGASGVAPRRYDLIVIGGGPAGMAAAIEAHKNGVEKILVLERERELGGILQQCIHNGFGLHIFKEELTGPEYAERFVQELKSRGIAYMPETMVLHLGEDKSLIAVNPQDGLLELEAGAVILAMGCRERARGAANIPGARPAGIFTAGTAQRFVNMEGYMVGRKVVIFGSGDIGLIMARRMTLEGAEVVAVVERKPYSEGLARNRVQCLEDFGIPLLLSHTIVDLQGKGRLEKVGIARTDEHKRPIEGTTRYIECDTLLLSRGLIPENELSKSAGVDLDPVTGGPVVNERMETSVPGIFACGNVVHVHDVVDWVTVESRKAGRGAAGYLLSRPEEKGSVIRTVPGKGVRYIVPQRIRAASLGDPLELLMRVSGNFEQVAVVVKAGGKAVKKIKRKRLTPGEMVTVRLRRGDLPRGGDYAELVVEVEREEVCRP